MAAPQSSSPDIVERLRDRDAVVVSGLFHAIPTMHEAAKEIERLREAVNHEIDRADLYANSRPATPTGGEDIPETCPDCGVREPCDEDCPNHVEPESPQPARCSAAIETPLADVIAAKANEPAFRELKERLDANINWPRYLPILKVRPTGVTSWLVMLPSGKEHIIGDEDWQAALTDTPAQPSPPKATAKMINAAYKAYENDDILQKADDWLEAVINAALEASPISSTVQSGPAKSCYGEACNFPSCDCTSGPIPSPECK